MTPRHERPDYVLNFPKPINTDIRFINGHWYLYERKSVYDSVTKRRYKKTIRCLGTITPDGLVPSKPRKGKQPENPAPEPDRAEPQKEGPVAEQGRALSSPPVPGGQVQEPFPGRAGKSTGDDALEAGAQTAKGLTCDVRRRTGNFTPPPADRGQSPIAEAGAVNYLYSLTGDMRACLSTVFPECWKVIYTVVLLRAIYREYAGLCQLQRLYRRSYLSRLYPDLRLDKDSLVGLLAYLGGSRERTEKYLRLMMPDRHEVVLVKGRRTLPLSPQRQISLPDYGPDSGEPRQLPLDMLYVVDINEPGHCVPAFYRQYTARIPICEAVEALLSGTGLLPKAPMYIGDKGTGDDPIFKLYLQTGRKYVVSVGRNSGELQGKIPLWHEFEGLFAFQGRAIAYHVEEGENCRFVTYLDFKLLESEASEIIAREEKNQKAAQKAVEGAREHCDGKADLATVADDAANAPAQATAKRENAAERTGNKKNPLIPRETGTFTLQTNRSDLSPEKLFLVYRNRPKTEEFFGVYDTTLGFDTSYWEDDPDEEAWLFLNHLAATITERVLDALSIAGKSRDITYPMLMDILSRYRACLKNGEWTAEPMEEEDLRLCLSLGFRPYIMAGSETP